MPPIKGKRPCVCGRKLLEMWFCCGTYTIKCPGCGREVYGNTKTVVIDNWNEMVRKGVEKCSDDQGQGSGD